jgi:hypothetical protein
MLLAKAWENGCFTTNGGVYDDKGLKLLAEEGILLYMKRLFGRFWQNHVELDWASVPCL